MAVFSGYTNAMEGFFTRIGWFSVVAVVVSYMTYLVAGNIVTKHATNFNDPVLVRDELKPNMHQLSGMLMVESSCDQLSLKTTKLSRSEYTLNFSTWREPSIACDEEWTPRAFHEVLFAPAAGVNFYATLDDVPISVGVIPILPRDKI